MFVISITMFIFSITLNFSIFSFFYCRIPFFFVCCFQAFNHIQNLCHDCFSYCAPCFYHVHLSMSVSFSISCSSSFCMLFLLFVFFLSVCIVYNDTFKVVIGSNFYVFLCLWLEVESEALDVMGVLMKDF